MRRIVLCLFALLISGCTRPYEPPEVVGETSFPGAMSLAADTADRRVRVIMAHGMCSGYHKYNQTDEGKNWVALRAGLIADAIGDTSFVPRDYTPTRQYPNPTGPGSAVQRVDMDLRGADGTRYDMSFLLWGDPFDAARAEIDTVQIADSTGYLPKRATLNALLKDRLMNDCFVDAVAYTGPRGDVVRRNMRSALCELLGGRISGANTGRTGETVACSGMAPASQTPVILVPESLGAKVVLDAFLALNDGAGGTRKAAALGPVRAIHLATHQLPLLDTALAPADVPRDRKALARVNAGMVADSEVKIENPLNDFLMALSAAPGHRTDGARLSVVVYYDPNDMFGYPLTSASLSPDLNVALTNVILSNAPTYAGLATNPMETHSNTARPGVARLIVHGSDGL